MVALRTQGFTFKEKVFLVMGRPNQYRLNKQFNTFLVTIIFLNVLMVVLETVPSLTQKYSFEFHLIELVSVAIFVVEYFLRFWTSSLDPRYGSGLRGKFKYLFSAFAIIDLLAIAPSLVSILFFVDLRMLKAVRLFRLVRLLKLARYSLAIFMFVQVFKKRKPELVITLTLGVMMMVISASLMYYVEHEAQPEKFSSIPATMWWSVATLTTVGYGDMYPITSLGKALGAMIAFLGVGLFALPAALLATGFAELQNSNFEDRTASESDQCPLCGNNTKKKSVALKAA